MAQLKDTTVTGDLSVSGNQIVTGTINTATHRDNIDSTNIIKVEFAQLLDPTQLNEEVTLVTIPAGYVGRLSHLGRNSIIGISYFQDGSVSQNATVTIYYTSELSGVEATVVTDIYSSIVSTRDLSPLISENSTIRAKITGVGVGHTSKILLEGIIYLQKL